MDTKNVYNTPYGGCAVHTGKHDLAAMLLYTSVEELNPCAVPGSKSGKSD